MAMKSLYPLRGIVAVVNTPFDEAGGIDLTALGRHIEYAMRNDVAGILIPALAAEVYALKPEEKLAMVKQAVAFAQGRCKIIGCATSPGREERLYMARELIGLGCDGVNAVIPYENDEQYMDEVREIAALEPTMLMLQDWNTGYGLPDALICRIFDEVDCFRCLKVETVPAGIKYSRMIEMCGNRLHVSGGWAVAQMLDALDRGVHAMMPTGMYEIYDRIYKLYQHSERTLAKQLFFEFTPILAFCNQSLEISIWFLKRMLFRQGIYATADTRGGFKPDEAMIRMADEMIDYAFALIERIKKDSVVLKDTGLTH
jgi:4-hydroxy-tetrahydrodipicolinate synthase